MRPYVYGMSENVHRISASGSPPSLQTGVLTLMLLLAGAGVIVLGCPSLQDHRPSVPAHAPLTGCGEIPHTRLYLSTYGTGPAVTYQEKASLHASG